jgi:hypothetical protein
MKHHPMSRIRETVEVVDARRLRVAGTGEEGEPGPSALAIILSAERHDGTQIEVCFSFRTAADADQFIAKARSVRAEVWPTPAPPR